MHINRANIADMFRGFNVIFKDAWTQAPSQYERVATVVPSSAAEEHYGWLGTMPRFREWLGDRVLHSLATSDFSIRNKPFEMSITIDRDHIEDDKLGVFKPIIQTMGSEPSSTTPPPAPPCALRHRRWS